MEKKFLAAAMVLTGVFIFAFFSNNAQPKKVQKKAATHSSYMTVADMRPADFTTITDTIPGSNADHEEISNETIHTTVNGKNYRMVIHDNQVNELYVNDKKIPADQIGNYKSVTKKIITESKADRRVAEKDMIASQKEMEESQKEMTGSQKEMEESKREQLAAEKDMAASKLEMEQERKEMQQEMEQSQKELEQSKKELEQSKMEMEQSKKEMQQNMQQHKKDMALARVQMEQSKKDMMLYKEKAAKDMEQSETQMEQSRKSMEQSMKSMEQSKYDMEQSKKEQEEIAEDLIKENIIKNQDALSSYQLNSEELIVNGIKQPGAIHKKFKDKYVKSKGWSRTYNYNVN